jgi:hypothetical protein
MSDDNPAQPVTTFETVGPEGPASTGRRRTVIAGVAVAVVAVLGGGAYAAYALLFGGGPQPADVLPASTVAVVSVDLDPSAGQKIAAIRSIRKIPALKKSLGLHTDDDLREFLFDKVVHASGCTSLDFDRDVLPWLGKRGAVAAVDLGETNPTPAIALQIEDQAEARKGFQALVDCTDPQDFAFAVGEDYLIASDSAAHAQAILAGGVRKPLADDASYQRWTGEAGDAGVLGFYVAPRAGEYAQDLLDQLGADLLGIGGGALTPGGGQDPLAAAGKALRDFKGLAGTIRFNGGGMELSVATGGITQLEDLATVGTQMGDLPSDTAVALGFGVTRDYAKRLVDQLSESDVSAAEDETGLDLPGDLQTLLGKAVTLSLGGDAPDSLESLAGPQDIPAGLVIHGDADRIKALVGTLEDHLGLNLADVPVEVDASGDKVALSTGGYGPSLLKNGSLGSADDFRDAVPHADEASAILFLDFDSKWRDALAAALDNDQDPGRFADFDANTRPLRSLGVSSWQDGDVTHALVKVTTN